MINSIFGGGGAERQVNRYRAFLIVLKLIYLCNFMCWKICFLY